MRTFLLACVAVLAGCGSSTPPAPPSFFALGGEVYRANDRLEAEKQVLRFGDEPRWFAGFPREVSQEEYDAWEKQQAKRSQQEPAQGERVHQIPTTPAYPQSIHALPLKDQGATLRLDVERDGKAAADEIVFTLTLAAGDRAIQREIEHRRTNLLPFLFAFTADGRPVSRESDGAIKEGGANQFIELVPAGSQKSWTIRVATSSLAGVVPADAKEIAIVAVFSERQHEGRVEGGPLAMGEVFSSDYLKERRPQIVVRSNAARLVRLAKGWSIATPTP